MQSLSFFLALRHLDVRANDHSVRSVLPISPMQNIFLRVQVIIQKITIETIGDFN